MKRTTACLLVHPRSGINLKRVPDVVTVLQRAGWRTDVMVKETKGETMALATRAARAGYDLVVAYGGDGTVNNVINGVLACPSRRGTAVGVIPGGTANVWAAEVGIPGDPVRAANALIESEARCVDVGHVGVESLTIDTAEIACDARAVSAVGARRHFLLMAGLGLDASLMRRTPQTLKHKLGVGAVLLTAIRHLPSLRTFPVVARTCGTSPPVWDGRALQLVVGNTRLYGKVTRMTPDALIDNGELDLAVITAGRRRGAFAQVMTLLLRGRPAHAHSKTARGRHFFVSVPATVDLQLDGSAVNLKKYLTASARAALKNARKPERVIVNYRFDAVPGALRVLVPSDYDGSLFGRKG